MPDDVLESLMGGMQVLSHCVQKNALVGVYDGNYWLRSQGGDWIFLRYLSVFLNCLKISNSTSAVEFGDNVLRDWWLTETNENCFLYTQKS